MTTIKKHHRPLLARRTLQILLALMVVATLVATTAWWRGRAPTAAAPILDEPTASTVAANAAVAQSLPLDNPQSFEDAKRGFMAMPSGQVVGPGGNVAWDYDKFKFVAGDAPPSANPSLWRQAKLNTQIGLFKVKDGIYQLRGFDMANITLIEGKTGWIVVDTLTNRETAAAAMAFARKNLGDKPVSALIFTHSHVDHFGGALGVISSEEVLRRKVPVVAPAGFLEEATSENILMGSAMGRRATWQFGNLLPTSPKGMIDAGLGKNVALASVGILSPNVVIDHTPQEMTLDGVKFVFQNAPHSEAPAELTFFLPEHKAFCGSEIMVQSMHNLYTLRGAKVRDSLKWSGYIDEAIGLFGADTEVYFASHHWPLWGNARIVDFMKKHRDTYRYLHDQTVRMINAGMKPTEIAEQIKLPASLQSSFGVRGYYGAARHNVKAIYQYYMGWFDGNPANLDPIPRADAATRYVALMGGPEKTLAGAQAAFDKGDFRWAAEVLNHLVFAQPDNQAAREMLGRTYVQLGYVAESAIWRNFYLTGAMELRSGLNGPGVDPTLSLDMLAQTSIEHFLVAMSAGLNGPAAEGKELKINLVFTDLKESYVLWIENSVLHHRKSAPDANANATLTLTKAVFLKMMTGSAKAQDMFMGDAIKVGGSTLDLVRFFTLIDKAPKTFSIVTP
jgi:alkyl sulfatase BDS1-like metallo-beta-lactamase superfamily hydrolase